MPIFCAFDSNCGPYRAEAGATQPMAGIFVTEAGDWVVMMLKGGPYLLHGESEPPLRPVHAGPDASAAGGLLLLRGNDPSTGASWVLVKMSEEPAAVNGRPIPTGIAVLRDRDELRIGDARAFFSDEELAAVGPYGGDDRPRCPRCAGPVEPGQDAVRCPGCGVVHHELGERRCWSYATSCTLCDQPTALDAGLRWSPEVL